MTKNETRFIKWLGPIVLLLSLVIIARAWRLHTAYVGLIDEGARLAESGLFVEAIQRLERALDLRRNHSNQRDAGLYYVVFPLGVYYAVIATEEDPSQFEVASEHLSNALVLAEENFGPESREFSETASELGKLYAFWSGECESPDRASSLLNEAEHLVQRALSAEHSRDGADTVRYGQLLNMLGSVYARQGRIEEAAGLYKKALETYDGKLPSNHELVGAAGDNYAEMERRLATRTARQHRN